MKKTFYITTPIYYPSDNLHIGHAYTTTIADCLARYKREKGYDVRFLTGSDEHGEKIQTIAQEKGVTPIEYVDGIVANIKELWKELQISNDDFIRTSEERHKQVVQKIFTRFIEQDDIYEGSYEGSYCIPCESFFTDAQLDENGNCPDCGRPVQKRSEQAYFFRMSKYADRLVEYYNSHPSFIEPDTSKNEMINNFIKPGLEDLCVSRTSFDWGIKVSEDPKHVIYVWIDALANYITSMGYLSDNDQLFNKYWSKDTEIIQLVGKEIARFHVIYWPIMLMALDLRLPDKVIAHGWIIMKDGKMSKSKGNVINPSFLIDRYGVDGLRQYLLSQIHLGSDGTYTPEQFINTLNTDLANNLGNLLNRVVAMINKYFNGRVSKQEKTPLLNDELIEFANKTIQSYMDEMDKFQIDKANSIVFEYVSRLNKYIDETQPWVLAKEEDKQEELQGVLLNLARGLNQVAILLKPFLINTPKQIFEQLCISQNSQDFNFLSDFTTLETISVITKDPIFNRLKLEDELAYLNGENNEK